VGQSTNTGRGGVTTHMDATGGYVKEIRCGKEWLNSDYCDLGGSLLSLSLCRRGFQDLLKVKPSSLFILCGCISIPIASLMSRSIYPVLTQRSFVSCSLIM
jgi:hypothetical protein